MSNNCGDVTAVTAVLQAHEKLYLCMRQHKSAYTSSVFQQTTNILDSLRDLKSSLEGSAIDVEKVTVDTKILQDKVRPQILMHVPSSMPDDVKSSIHQHILTAFNGTCKSVEFIGLLTNPWYSSMHVDRGLQAKHNSLLVVYSYKPDQFLSPVDPHASEQHQVIDEGWFTAVELGHAAQYMVRGSVRYMEAIYLPEAAIVHQSEAWKQLSTSVKRSNPLMLRTLLEQARGQAVGKVAKKRRSGHMGLKNGASLYEFCESFTLLDHMHQAVTGGQLQLEQLTAGHGQLAAARAPTDMHREAFTKLHSCYAHEESDSGAQTVTKEELLDTLMAWKTQLEVAMGKQFTQPKCVEQCVSEHMLAARCDGRQLPPPEFGGSSSDEAFLKELTSRLGGAMAGLDPARIIMVAQAGSALYDLQTPTSDVDYVIIYADPAKEVVGSCRKRTESCEKRGPQLQEEYGAYEARILADMLWKGSVVILELAFSEKLNYMSTLWKELVSDRHKFLTERAILQYFGLIKNNMTMIEGGKYKDQPRERKLFYQVFHKLHTLEYFARAEIPPVRCSGATRDFIMSIRTGPLEGEISREKLLQKANSQIQDLRKRLADRQQRLPENVNLQYLTNWIKRVRGWRD